MPRSAVVGLPAGTWPRVSHEAIAPEAALCRRFVDLHGDEAATGDLSSALRTCTGEGAVEVRQTRSGNKYLRITTTVGITFQGVWAFRAVTRAFLGNSGVGRARGDARSGVVLG